MEQGGRNGVVELVRHAQRGDEAAMEDLAALSTRLAFRLVGAYSGRCEDTADIVQVVVLDVFLHIRRLRKAERFFGWLRRIAHRRTVDFLRRKYREETLGTILTDVDLELLPDGRVQGTLFGILERERRDALEREIEKLPPKYAQVLLPIFRDGLRYGEIAAKLAMPEATARTRYHRGVGLLKKRIGRGL